MHGKWLFPGYQSPVIPAWVHRRVVHCLHGASLWSDPHMWLTARHVCLSRLELSCPPAAKHGIDNWFDIRDYTHTLSLHVTYAWIWAPTTEAPAVFECFLQHRPLGYMKSPAWTLIAPITATCGCDEIQLWRIHLLLAERRSSYIHPPIPSQSTLVCRALTMQMQVALDDKNLGRWAELMQIRTRYLPLDRHPPWPWRAVSATPTTGGWPLPPRNMSSTWFTTSGYTWCT